MMMSTISGIVDVDVNDEAVVEEEERDVSLSLR